MAETRPDISNAAGQFPFELLVGDSTRVFARTRDSCTPPKCQDPELITRDQTHPEPSKLARSARASFACFGRSAIDLESILLEFLLIAPRLSRLGGKGGWDYLIFR